jgi:DNA topoisomerase-1
VAGKKSKKALVIVESPAKAKKIGGFLGKDYEVRASMGHIRDLPEKAADIPPEVKKLGWSTLGVNVKENFAPLYIVPGGKKALVKELKSLLKDSEELILATDEDREGESIGWHLMELLEPKVPVRRMVFSEITKEAILEALDNTRDLDMNLVRAQETRRIVDRLYGYTLSPLLWKKIRPRLSAGRVQSVAVRILVKRELERLAFRKGTYWDLKADLETGKKETFSAELSSVGGKRIASGKDFDENTGKIKAGSNVLLLEETAARDLQNRLRTTPWSVTGIETRQQVRRPPPPFTTSTLQQEANRKLGLSAREAMQVAQRLYEDGLITYMRTDSVSLSSEAVNASRGRIQSSYGADYLSPAPRQYATKTKNAQEAHEAVRPAGKEMKTADEQGLSGREFQLYDMIWKRTMACQMADAQLKFTTAVITAGDAEFRATGRQIEFAGYFRAYVEGQDDAESALEDQQSSLPDLKEKDSLACEKVDAIGHETKPPARYTEATLVGKMEAEGIGRPSTYASIIGTIQDRGYVRKVGNQLIPTFTALAVNKLLEGYFPRLVDMQFTAQMEQSLDDISNGQVEYIPYLSNFFLGDDGLESQVKTQEESIDPRAACTLKLDGVLSDIRVGKFGPYLEMKENDATFTASLPDDIAPADLNNEMATKLLETKKQGPQALGMHPDAGVPVLALVGPFGPYVQLGEVSEENPKPKRVSIPRGTAMESVNLDMALSLLTLPRTLGEHPENGKPVLAGIGRFGPYVQNEKTYKSLQKTDDVLTVGLARALELLSQARVKTGPAPIRELGKHPEDQEPVNVYEGRYGQYVKHGDINATIPKDKTAESITLEEALDLIKERAAAGGGSKKGRKTAKKKAPAKKTSEAKKAAPKKKSPKKKPKAEEGEE